MSLDLQLAFSIRLKNEELQFENKAFNLLFRVGRKLD